jgi:hypothetical protein
MTDFENIFFSSYRKNMELKVNLTKDGCKLGIDLSLICGGQKKTMFSAQHNFHMTNVFISVIV